LQVANSRPVTRQQPVNIQPTTYQQIANPSYWGNTLNAAANMVRPYGGQPKNPQRQESAYNGMPQNESEMERKLDKILARTDDLNDRLKHRDGPANSEVQPTSDNPEYARTANAKHTYNNARPDFIPPKTRQHQMGTENQAENFANDNKGKQKSSSRFDLFWLLVLLLISVGLNLFLWLHSRSLHLQYNDLAVELREMVGVSTV